MERRFVIAELIDNEWLKNELADLHITSTTETELSERLWAIGNMGDHYTYDKALPVLLHGEGEYPICSSCGMRHPESTDCPPHEMRHREQKEELNSSILPCPFCSGTDIRFTKHPKAGKGFHQYEDVWSTCCYDCGATFPNMYSKQLLIDKWNRRPSQPSPTPTKAMWAAWARQLSYRLITKLYGSHEKQRQEVEDSLLSMPIVPKE